MQECRGDRPSSNIDTGGDSQRTARKTYVFYFPFLYSGALFGLTRFCFPPQTGDQQQQSSNQDDLLVANPNHSASAWRPLRRSRKGKLGANGEQGDGADDSEGLDGQEDDDEEYDSEELDGDGYDEDEEVETDALGNTIPKKKVAPAATNGTTETESVETIEQGAAQLSTSDRA